jgi:hypothetical protein
LSDGIATSPGGPEYLAIFDCEIPPRFRRKAFDTPKKARGYLQDQLMALPPGVKKNIRIQIKNLSTGQTIHDESIGRINP